MVGKALGVLTVEVLAARNLPRKDFLGKNDPYAIIHFGRQSQSTHIIKNAGASCVWNQTFYFDVTLEVREISIEVYDKDTLTKDDFIGTTAIMLDPILQMKGSPPQWYPLRTAASRVAGEIQLAFVYRPLEQQGVNPVSTGPVTYDSLYPIREEMKRSPQYPSPSSSAIPQRGITNLPQSGTQPNPFADSSQISSSTYPSMASSPYRPSYPPPSSSFPSSYPASTFPTSSYPQSSTSYPPSSYPPPAAYPPPSSSSPYPPPSSAPYPPPSSAPYPPPSSSPYPPPSSAPYPPAPSSVYPPPFSSYPAPFLDAGLPMPVASPSLPGWDFSGARRP